MEEVELDIEVLLTQQHLKLEVMEVLEGELHQSLDELEELQQQDKVLMVELVLRGQTFLVHIKVVVEEEHPKLEIQMVMDTVEMESLLV